MTGWKKRPFWIRLLHWEYWSFDLIYLPIYPVFLFLCLRARSFFFFAAANPKIENGGFLGESKKDIHKLVPDSMQPATVFFERGTPPGEVLEKLLDAGLGFPMIGKPDIGGRGRGVRKLVNKEAVLSYASDSPFDFLIQEFISYENEAGIFYWRLPGQKKGNISGIVHKEFLKVEGDGSRNIRDLLSDNPRGILQIPYLEKSEPDMLEHILYRGESFTVSPYGNHARGALFLDDSASVTSALVEVLDSVCSQIPEFYYGRLDVRYENRILLEKGKSFSIIEVNGAGSEPTHIYDPRHNLLFAWKEIIRHWFILYKISRVNHRLGHPYLSFQQGVAMFRKDRIDSGILANLQKVI